jgi:hypothetical protein
MAILIQPVRPGEVISAARWNEMLDQLNNLNNRLAALETGTSSGSGQIITGFNPPSQIELGKELTISGKFDFPPAINSVSIDGIPILTFRAGSNDSQLLFLVPTGITIPASGSKSAKIRVSNSKGVDEKSYLLLKATPSSVPNPQITTAINLQDTLGDPTILQTLKKARITGTNFAANPAENIIKFKIQTAAGTIVYPLSGQTIAIDVAQTNTTKIELTVPDITQIAPGSTASVILEVGVGTAVPDSKPFTVFHP